MRRMDDDFLIIVGEVSIKSEDFVNGAFIEHGSRFREDLGWNDMSFEECVSELDLMFDFIPDDMDEFMNIETVGELHRLVTGIE